MEVHADEMHGRPDCAAFVQRLLELQLAFSDLESDDSEVLQTLCDKVITLGAYESARCVDLTSPDGALPIVAAAGHSSDAAGTAYARTAEALARCAQTRRPLLLVDESLDRSDGAAVLLLPLIVRQVCVAAVVVHARHATSFGPDESDFLQLAMQQCSLALTLRQEYRAKQEALSQLNLKRAILDNAAEGVIVTDREGTILSVNPAVCRVTGYSMDELVGQTPRVLQSGMHDATFYASMWAAIHRAGTWKGEIWNRRKNGEIYPEWLSISAIRNASQEVEYYIAIFTDISYQKEIEETLRFQALHDPLTGLANRQLFQDSLERALSPARIDDRAVAVLLLDLDHFKPVNDTLGHAEGDLLLQQVAARLMDSVRKRDTVARLGGDEFAILVNSKDGAKVARKIIDAMSRPFELAGRQHGITVSIGISLYPNDGDSTTMLMRKADLAMYHAKAQGRDTYCYYTPELDQPYHVGAEPRRDVVQGQAPLIGASEWGDE